MRRTRNVFLIAGWLALVCAGHARAECKMVLASRLPVTQSKSRLLVPAMLNNKPAQFVLDTGASTSLLASKAVDRLGLRIMSSEEFSSMRARVGGIGGERATIGVTARSFELGGLHARGFNFIAADLGGTVADGLLSVDLISNYDVDLDLEEHQVVLYKPVGDCSAPAAFLSGPLYAVPMVRTGNDQRPRVHVTIGGQDFIALIDTGASSSAIFRSAAAKLGIGASQLTADRRSTVIGVGPRHVTAARHVFESITVGDLSIANMPIDVLDNPRLDSVDMLLGIDFQSSVHLWISYSSNTLIMQYPPQPSKKMSAG